MGSPQATSTHTALVVGTTGIAGSAIAARLIGQGWKVLGLSRNPHTDDRVESVLVDLRDGNSVRASLAQLRPTHVFYTSWVRMPTERENCDVNGGMLRNVLDALEPGLSVRHVALMTGLKHYLGPFESYGQGDVPDTPFHEDEPRLPGDNFYYTQEDELITASARDGFTWSVHRAHTVIGYAVGNVMNMGLTLAVQAAICRETSRPLVFPGSSAQWNGLTDMTDSGILADHMIWAATNPQAADTAFNIVNGDVFRWRWLWPKLAEYFELPCEGFSGSPQPLAVQMADAETVWPSIAAKYDLIETDLNRLASWWHTDGDLGREMETLADMARSRRAGFCVQIPTLDAFIQLFDRYRINRLVP